MASTMTAARVEPRSRRVVPGRVPPFTPGRPPLLDTLVAPWVPLRIVEALVGGPVTLDRALWEEMVEGLTEEDEPMARVVEEMFSLGAREGRRLFEMALEKGIDAVPSAPPELRSFFDRIDRRPAWVDMRIVRRGSRAVCAGGKIGIYLARDLANMGGYQLAGFNETLVRAGGLVKGAGKRFAETMSWTMDIYSPEGMERFGVGFKNTMRVRLVHALVNRNLKLRKDWDARQWGVPINQTDMLATILFTATSGFGGRLLGTVGTQEEADAITHHGAYVGWLLGVKDSFRVRSTAEGIRYLIHAVSTHPLGGENCRLMASSLAREPLGRHYERFEGLRRRFEYSKHLSISRIFLRKTARENLGIETVFPWYPLATIPARFVWQGAHRLIPGGYRRLIESGRKDQLELLQHLERSSRSAGGLIQPDASHPAHV